MKPIFTLLFVLLCANVCTKAQSYKLASPDGKTTINITVDSSIKWSVAYNNDVVLQPSALALQLASGKTLGDHSTVKKTATISVNQVITSPVPVKNKHIPNVYNQLHVMFKEGFNVSFRAYNDGVAYRFETMLKDSQTVNNELVSFNFPANYQTAWPFDEPFSFRPGGAPTEDPGFGSKNPPPSRMGFGGPPPPGPGRSGAAGNQPPPMMMPVANPLNISYEYLFKDKVLNNVADTAGLPIYLSTDKGVKLVVLEADLYDYPNLFVKGNKSQSLSSVFPHVVLKEESGMGGMSRITQTADYIAKTGGTRTYPWRAIAISDDDKGLLQNELVYKLSTPPVIPTDWIKPGQVVWEWWHGSNLYNVDFKAGINTASYKYYIDFASAYKVPYMLIDAGWRNNAEVDITAITDYAKQKNVRVMLWMAWSDLLSNINLLDTFKTWGIAGVKMDYMNRADQAMVNVFEKVAIETAKRNLLIDFHGAYKPVGLNRKYPNVVNYESVKGMEHDKLGSTSITPSHDVNILFTRMVAGPLDYTPGAMHNAAYGNFKNIPSEPMSQGTRAHQAAMYVLYDAPIQMLADNPVDYMREDAYTKFITAIPTTWDTTIAIAGKIGQYAITARKKDNKWYIGAMTDWSKRDMDITLAFLEDKKYSATILADGINADKHGADYKLSSTTIGKGDNIKISMNNGGGWVAVLSPTD